MSIGRKKSSKPKAPAIQAPPQVTQYQFNSPTGDRYITRRDGATEITESLLSPQTHQTVQTGLNALGSLAQELYRPDAHRVDDINQRARDFYDLQSQAIHAESDDLFSRASSSLAKRFGGTYNATFGTDFLAQLEKNRLSKLSDAVKEAALLAEDLYSRDEASRMDRFNLFANYLNSEYDKARGAASQGGAVLQNEANRAQDLAVTRARMLEDAARRQESEDAYRSARIGAMTKLIPLTLGAISSSATGGASTFAKSALGAAASLASAF